MDFFPLIYIGSSLAILFILRMCILRPRGVLLDPSKKEDIQAKIRLAMEIKND